MVPFEQYIKLLTVLTEIQRISYDIISTHTQHDHKNVFTCRRYVSFHDVCF